VALPQQFGSLIEGVKIEIIVKDGHFLKQKLFDQGKEKKETDQEKYRVRI
jgi:hypothetical protein